MARQQVMQVQCDRCKRVELQPVMEGEKAPELTVVFGMEKLVYNDLCSSCRSAITRLIGDMRTWQRELKQGLLGPVIQGNEAPPVSSAPNYTPPKPHK